MSFSSSSLLTGPVLEGRLVRLEPLGRQHAGDLAVACDEDRTSYSLTWVPTASEVGNYIDAQQARAADGQMAPYVVVDRSTSRAVGATSYFNPRRCRTAVDRRRSRSDSPGWLPRHRAPDQRRGQVSPARPCVPGVRVARVDLKTDALEQPLPGRYRGDRRHLRGRSAALVAVLGTRRGRAVARLRDLLDHRRGVAPTPRTAGHPGQTLGG